MTSGHIGRRSFLKNSFLTYLAFNFPLSLKAQTSIQGRDQLVYATGIKNKYFLNSFHLETQKHSKLEVPFQVHSVTALGQNKFLLIPRKGPECCIADLSSSKILKSPAQDPKYYNFYGHAQIDYTGQKIFMPQRVGYENHIYMRSLSTLDKEATALYKTKKEIHMISFVEKDRLAICLDDKISPAIEILNINTLEVQSYPIENHYFRPGHLCPIQEGEIMVTGIVGDDYDAAAILNYHSKNLSYYDKTIIQKLSPVFWLSHHAKFKISCGVSPYSNQIVFISDDSRKIVKQLNHPEPYGVDIIGDDFVVIGPKGISYFDAKNLKKVKEMGYPDMQYILEDFHPITL